VTMARVYIETYGCQMNVADAVVSGRLAGKVEAVTEDYLSLYLPVDEWDGRARFEVTIR
jgi:hypothetical protein